MSLISTSSYPHGVYHDTGHWQISFVQLAQLPVEYTKHGLAATLSVFLNTKLPLTSRVPILTHGCLDKLKTKTRHYSILWTNNVNLLLAWQYPCQFVSACSCLRIALPEWLMSWHP